ncbi:unnamed protein product [Toxocara canis]|uniref:Secreted protein n=1 Tax=Toxocara canis TaxID=6265 RepID=A0A183U847_TOXCA|nr:unnamed protein product [Toxocara canis]
MDWHPGSLAQQIDGSSSDRSQSSAGFSASRSKRFIQLALPLTQILTGGLLAGSSAASGSALIGMTHPFNSGHFQHSLDQWTRRQSSQPFWQQVTIHRTPQIITNVVATPHLPNEPDDCKPVSYAPTSESRYF